LFSGGEAKSLADQKITEISPMAKIGYPYDWAELLANIEKDFDKKGQ
tara:strand:+ start:95 stop:235 length:141 start_codon:yes stop_codon:yes gene_type:complete